MGYLNASSESPGEVNNISINRNSSSSLLTTCWSPLPSLDLNDTAADPDIVYGVELYKITCGEDIFMSREDVFVNSTNVDPMETYKVIITARNNVERAKNGTSVEMRGEWCHM